MDDYKKFYLVGIYFVVLELVFLTSLVDTKDYTGSLWACNIVPALFAFGFFTKNFRLIKGVLNFILFPHLIFMVVALIFFLTGLNLINIKIGFTTFGIGFRAILFHLFSANVALYFTRKIEPDKKSIIYSIIIFFIIFILTALLTPPALNINFVRSSKVIVGFDIPFMTFIWPLFVFSVFVIPSYYLQKIISRRSLSVTTMDWMKNVS